jgi:hypothetical protein
VGGGEFRSQQCEHKNILAISEFKIASMKSLH